MVSRPHGRPPGIRLGILPLLLAATAAGQGLPADWCEDLGRAGDARCRAIDNALRAPDAAVASAVRELQRASERGGPATPPVLDVVYVLGLLEDRALGALPALGAWLDTDDAVMLQQVVWAIGAIGPHATADARESLARRIDGLGYRVDERPFALARLALGAGADDAQLVAALVTTSPCECAAAAEAIAWRRRASDRVLDQLFLLRDALETPAQARRLRAVHGRVRLAVARAIAATRPCDAGAPRALHVLLGHHDHRERLRAVQQLAHHQPSAIDAESVNAVAGAVRDESSAVRAAAILTLASFGPRAVRYTGDVEQAARERPELAPVAAAALRRIAERAPDDPAAPSAVAPGDTRR